MIKSALPIIELNPTTDAKAVVICLHGLGASGYDFVPWIKALTLSTQAIRFVLPHAPIRSVTINQNMKMRAWYDIATFDLSQKGDIEGILDSQQVIEHYIEKECEKGIPADRIILLGFSQGGAMAIHSGLCCSKRLAGMIALSTYLPCSSVLSTKRHPANYDTPIFMAHGIQDSVVPWRLGQLACSQLLEWGYKVDWQNYQMNHTIIPTEMFAITNFISKVIKSTD